MAATETLGTSSVRSTRAHSAVFDDCDAQAQHLREYAQVYVQTSEGRFRGRAASVRIGRVLLHRETANRRLLQWIRSPPNRIGIGCDLDENETQMDGVPLGRDRFFVCPPSCTAHLHGSPGSTRMLLVMDVATLESTPGPIPRVLRADHGGSHVLEAPGFVTVLRTRTAALWAAVATGDDRLAYQELGDGIVTTIKWELALQERIGHLARVNRPGSYKTYRRGIHAMVSNPAEKLDLAALARLTGRSIRSIQHAFARHAGITPSRCLNALKLARVRRLLSTDTRDRPISDLAAESGFFDQSHFNRLYREQFDETPCERRRKDRG